MRQFPQCPLEDTLTLVTIFIIMTKEISSLYNHYTIEAKQLTGSGEHKAPTAKKKNKQTNKTK